MQFIQSHKTILAVVAGCLLLFALLLAAPPLETPLGVTIVVRSGESAPEIAAQLKNNHVILHPVVLRAVLRVSGGSGRVQAGAYRFNEPENLFTIARRLETGDYGLPPVKVTFLEGETVRDYAEQLAGVLPGVTADEFNKAAAHYEGYLFPDTYIFAPGAEVDDVIAALRENFDKKIAPLLPQVASSTRSLSDTVILASLVEREARTIESRRMVAGILLNRLRINMPLQVDAVFGYIKNRDTYSPSYSDLKIDSPYNTYIHKGLPPGPICNPSLDSIEAVLAPTPSKYLYYLTDRQGNMHYATTYAAQLANQAKYLP